jgi:hypothetical protein
VYRRYPIREQPNHYRLDQPIPLVRKNHPVIVRHRTGSITPDRVLRGANPKRQMIVAWGDEPTIAKRVREHLDAGTNHVLLQPLGDLNEALRQLESPGARSARKLIH